MIDQKTFEIEGTINPDKTIFLAGNISSGIHFPFKDKIDLRFGLNFTFSPVEYINDMPFELIGEHETITGTLSRQHIKTGIDFSIIYNFKQ